MPIQMCLGQVGDFWASHQSVVDPCYFDEAKIRKLKVSLGELGMINAIQVVRETCGKLRVADGMHRLRAAAELRPDFAIPYIILSLPDEPYRPRE